jgi:hypothetical protein
MTESRRRAVYRWTVVIGSNGGLTLQLQDLRDYIRVLGTGFHLEDTPYFHKNLARLLAEVFLLPDVAVFFQPGRRQTRKVERPGGRIGM